MSHFSFKLQKLPIFKVLNLRKANFNRFNNFAQDYFQIRTLMSVKFFFLFKFVLYFITGVVNAVRLTVKEI